MATRVPWFLLVGHCHGGEAHHSGEEGNTLRVQNYRVTPRTSKRDQFAKWALILNCHICAPSVHVPRVSFEPSVVYVSSI